MEHFHITIDSDQIATLWINVHGKSVNAISPAVLDELKLAIAELESAKPKGLIIASGKPGRFVAGADLFEIRKMESTAVMKFLADGQEIFDKLAHWPTPTAAAIGGDCLGGGLELALACTYRVAADSGRISIGLPEVKLGILPGWGGTTRLPRLLGLKNALPLLLAGTTLPPRKAMKVGIIDEIVRPEALLDACKRLIRKHPKRRHVPLAMRVAAATPVIRHGLIDLARKHVLAKTGEHYPAPMKVLDVVRTGLDRNFAAGLKAEREALAELMQTEAAHNLMRLFFLRQGAKRAVLEQIDARPAEVKHAAVIGGGTMGAGIVHALIRSGIKVRLIEVDSKAISAALRRVSGLLADDQRAGRMSSLEARNAIHLVSPSTRWSGLRVADLAIEAVIENLDLKRDVFARLAKSCRTDAVLATNTSSLLVRDIAPPGAASRVVGIHFFNPVPKMTLVEIVRTEASDAASLATAAGLALQVGKTPVLVNDSPGFLVNRVLIPYLAEALALAGEGVDIAAIDQAIKKWGMPMGPFELLDEIGLDVANHVLASLGGGQPRPECLRYAVENKWLGRKSGIGFYRYGKKQKKVNAEMARLARGNMQPANLDAADIQWRLVLPMVNESARLLEEGVAQSSDAIDLAMTLGTGFAPFRGGPVNFADSVGAAQIVRRLRELAAKYGQRFTPADLLARIAQSGGKLSEISRASGAEKEVRHADLQTTRSGTN